MTVVVDAVRRDDLGSQELLDIAASLDKGEREFVGPGDRDAWYIVAMVATALDCSAQFVVDETIHALGW
jgi:hypothetical protein